MTPNLHFLTHPRVARMPELSWLGAEMRENVGTPAHPLVGATGPDDQSGRPDGHRADEPWRARLRHLLAAAQGADRLPGHAGIDDQVANLIIAQLLFLAREDPDKDITMYINSPAAT